MEVEPGTSIKTSHEVLDKICKSSFYNNPDAIIVTDREGVIRYENPTAGVMFGYSPGELLRKPVEVLIPSMYRMDHRHSFRNYTDNPVPRKMSNRTTLKARRKDGSEFFVSISLQSFQESGVSFFMAIIRDTSEYVEKNEHLDQTLEQLSRVMKFSRIGNWELDHRTGELTWADETFKIFELDKESFTPSLEAFVALIHEEDRDFVLKSFRNSLDNNIPYNIVHRYTLPTGGQKYLRERCETIFLNGKPTKSLGSVQDVTEVQTQRILLKNSVRDLELKNKELEEYTFIAAHDLQEPLNTILGISQLLREDIQDSLEKDSEVMSYLQFIEDSSLRLKSLIKSVMETARLGKVRKFEEVNLNVVLKESIQDLKGRIKRTGARIEYDELPSVNASPLEIKLLFQNLISNALKFQRTGVKPEIKITFNDIGHEWLFCIEDNGIGIDPASKEKLFKMFRRLHSDDEYEGTGVGLAQCKKIVELHNGEIWVESKPGNGSLFYFSLSKSLL